MAARWGAEKALDLLRTLPRVTLYNLKKVEGPKKRQICIRGQHALGGKSRGPKKGSYAHQNYIKIGYETGNNPFYLRIPKEPYYKNHHLTREYPRLSLYQLQLMIDTGLIDPSQPIDITAICNTKMFLPLKPFERESGYHVTEEGIDIFQAKVNLEVQWASEQVIAAVERNGGVITTAFYDVASLLYAIDPEKCFSKNNNPIPRRELPPQDAVEYYTDPKSRGYLADPELIAQERLVLAQKYGYALPDISKDPQKEMLLKRKDPRQVFYGLQPGWIVNMQEKIILKPKDPELLKYYNN